MKRILVLALCAVMLFAVVFTGAARAKASTDETFTEAEILDAIADHWIITCKENVTRCGDGLILYGLGNLNFLSEGAAREIYLPLKDGLFEEVCGKEDVHIELNFADLLTSLTDAGVEQDMYAFCDTLKGTTEVYCSFTDVEFGTKEYELKMAKKSDIFAMIKEDKFVGDVSLMEFIKENYAFTIGMMSCLDALKAFDDAKKETDLAQKRALMLYAVSLATFGCEMSIENCDEIVKSAYNCEEIKSDVDKYLDLVGKIADNGVDVVENLVPEIEIAMTAIELTMDIGLKTLSMSGKMSALSGYMQNPDTIETDMNAYYQALSNQYDKFTYSISDFEITMEEYKGYLYAGEHYKVVDVPEELKAFPGFPVVAFDGVFAENLPITEITIPSTIRSRNYSTVVENCDKLTKVTYCAPDCQDGSYGYFFSGCDGELVIEFEGEIQTIPERFIYNCGLTSIAFPEGVTTIHNGALVDCPNLETVTIPSTVETFEINFGDKAIVEGCPKLATVNYNALNADAGYHNAVFADCGNDAEEMQIVFGPGIKVTPRTFLNNCGVKELIFPDGLTQIRENAAVGCEKLETITIPYTVACFSDVLGTHVFAKCNNLKTVNYYAANAVGKVGGYIFDEIESDFTINFGAQVESIPEHFIFKCYLTEIAFPDGVKTINERCLMSCDFLKTVTVPATAETIAYDFIDDCCRLENVYFNANCTNLNSSAMISDCGGLLGGTMTVHLGDNVTAVPQHFIENCAITEFVYPEDVKTIHAYSLVNCYRLESVVIPSTVEEIGYHAIADCHGLKTIEYNALSAQRMGTGYVFDSSGAAEGLTILFAENISSLPECLMYCCNVRSLTFPAGITTIPEKVAVSCAALNSLTIPQNITDIGDEAFRDATGLTEIHYLAVAVNDLDYSNGIFSDAGKDSPGITVFVGDKVTKIPNRLFCPNYNFLGAPKITGVQFAEGSVCTSIGKYAFGYCADLASVTIPSSVDTICENAFYKCTGLTDLSLGSVKNIGDSVFCGCKGLKSVVIPNSVTALGEEVFADCTALAQVTIGGGLATVPAETFKGCTALTWVSIPGNITEIEYSAFSGCTNLAGIALQDSIATIEFNAFEKCDNLASVIYCGTLLQWRQIDIDESANEDFLNANLLYHNWVDHPDTDRKVCSICGMFACEPTSHTYVAEVTEPTCLEAGYTIYICSTCGHIYVGDHADATGHTFEDGICSVCDAWDPIKWVGTQLLATSRLDMQFALRVSDLKNTDGNYIVLTRTYADGRTPDEIVIKQKDWTQQGNFYIVSYSGLSAKEMGDVVSAVVYNKKAAVISEVRSESIESYALSMLGKITNAEQKTMFVDLLNYGAEAQKFFHYNEENLANANLTDEQKTWGTQEDIQVADNRVKGENFYGSNLSLENVILLQMAFKVEPADGMYAMVSYTDHTGKEVEEKLAVEDNNGYAMISVNSLAIADYRTLVTCTLYDADGNVVGSAVDSMASYVARSQTDLGKAIMKFGASAYAYFH